jgi:ABC-type Fe3+ transport system substrate-binding protein
MVAPDQGQSTIDAWNKQFPKVKLNLTVELSKYLDSRVDRQFQKNGHDGADIAVLQQLNDFDRWTRLGRLLPYKPASWDTIYPDVKDTNGAFVAILFCECRIHNRTGIFVDKELNQDDRSVRSVCL